MLKSGKKRLKDLSLVTFISTLLLVIASIFIETQVVAGNSMEPTIPNGARIVVYKGVKEVKKGDVVVFYSPDSQVYIKRVIDDSRPDEGFFVTGDNGTESRDSRTFGRIKQKDIVGKAIFILSPPKFFGTVKGSPTLQ